MYTVLYALSRKEGMSREDFSRYYRDVHTGFGKKVPNLRGYDVFLVEGSPDGEGNSDAFAVMQFDSEADFQSAAQSPEMAAAGEDAGNFAGAFSTFIVQAEKVI